MWEKLKEFWHAPFLNKLHSLSNLYYKMKGRVLYRFCFKEFGNGSYIRRPLLILNASFISIGDRVFIREGARLEVVRGEKHRNPELRVGNGSSIEQNVHILCHHRIRIGENVAVSGNCCIMDVTHPYEDIETLVKVVERIQDDEAFVEIGDGALIGFGTVILPNVRIGKCAVIGANSVVVQDIPDYTVAAGAPARPIKQFQPTTGTWVRVAKDVAVESLPFG